MGQRQRRRRTRRPADASCRRHVAQRDNEYLRHSVALLDSPADDYTNTPGDSSAGRTRRRANTFAELHRRSINPPRAGWRGDVAARPRGGHRDTPTPNDAPARLSPSRPSRPSPRRTQRPPGTRPPSLRAIPTVASVTAVATVGAVTAVATVGAATAVDAAAAVTATAAGPTSRSYVLSGTSTESCLALPRPVQPVSQSLL